MLRDRALDYGAKGRKFGLRQSHVNNLSLDLSFSIQISSTEGVQFPPEHV